MYTIPNFITWLETRESWDGIYWSSQAIHTISNKYFANWYALLDIIQENKKLYENVATVDEKREEKVKLRDAVELSGFFEIIDQTAS